MSASSMLRSCVMELASRRRRSRQVVGDDLGHRNIMRQRVNRSDRKAGIADADDPWLHRKRRQRPVEIASTVAQAKVVAIETDKGRQENIRPNFIAALRHGYIPEAAYQWLAWSPRPKNHWGIFLHDHRQ